MAMVVAIKKTVKATSKLTVKREVIGDEKMKDDDDAGAKAEDGEEEENSGTVAGNEEDAEMSDEESEYEVGELIHISPVMAASIKKSFMAMIQFFEATTRETLRPTQRNEARPPGETCENWCCEMCRIPELSEIRA